MTAHARLDEAARERAALHALGALELADAANYEKHLEICACCRTEVHSLREIVGELALAAPKGQPPAGAKERLFERLGLAPEAKERAPHVTAARSRQAWKGWRSDQVATGFTYRPSDDDSWESTAIEGIEARRLFVDAEHDRVTMMVRMAPGTEYPAHVHGGPEECFVLQGDIRVGPELHMRAGDYQRMEGGQEHPVQSTDEGCVLLIVSSLSDELIDESLRT